MRKSEEKTISGEACDINKQTRGASVENNRLTRLSARAPGGDTTQLSVADRVRSVRSSQSVVNVAGQKRTLGAIIWPVAGN